MYCVDGSAYGLWDKERDPRSYKEQTSSAYVRWEALTSHPPQIPLITMPADQEKGHSKWMCDFRQ